MTTLKQRERLSALLVNYCKEHNFSGADLGIKLDVSQQSAHRYLTGVTMPKEDVRKRIAKLLGITPEELQAKIEGISARRKLSAEDLAREIRLMPAEEFNQTILPVMFERIEDQLTSQKTQQR